MRGVADTSETIVAVATAPGPAARGVVRISGPQAWAIVGGLLDDPPQLPSAASQLVAATLRVPELATPLAVHLWCWQGTSGFTGQPAVEVHALGVPPLLEAMARACCAGGARLARPGEFALRAFLAGKIDLLQAEAIVGLIDASDRSEFQVALAQLAGGVAGPLNRLRDELIDLLALLEAGLDFVEEDIEFVTAEALDTRLTALAAAVDVLRQQIQTRAGEELLPTVALVGAPNAGKSSLFNALLQRDAAIVAPLAGTTRDYLRAVLAVGNCRVQLVDTAGVDEESDQQATSEIGRLATARSGEQARLATVQLVCLPAEAWAAGEPPSPPPAAGEHGQVLQVVTKCDAIPGFMCPPGYLATSSWTGAGLQVLRESIRHAVLSQWRQPQDVIPATASRCTESLAAVAAAVEAARQSLAARGSEELVASDLHVALEHLGSLVGAIYTDDVLDRVFSKFCIGK